MCIAAFGTLALAPARAGAAAGLYLTWSDCALGGAGQSSYDFACDGNGGTEELYCALTLPQATGPDVLGVIAVVDLQHSAAALPDWWRLGAVGGCRSGMLSASGDFRSNGTCVDPWVGQAVAEVQGYAVGEPRGGANQVRVKVACGVVPSLAATLDATSMYYGVKLVIGNGLTSGPGTCVGCAQPACLVLNSIEVKRTPGAPGGDLFLETPGAGGANWALWQGGMGANCALVPVRSVTWGRVKSIYR